MIGEVRKTGDAAVGRKRVKKLFRVLLVLIFLLAAFFFFKVGEFYRNAEGAMKEFGIYFGAPPAFAAENKEQFTFKDGETYYFSGELSLGDARDIFRVNPDASLREFRTYVKKAIEDYANAFYIWKRLYDSGSLSQPKGNLERARLLDAMNHALWRMLPFFEKSKQGDVKKAINRNWIEALDAIEEYEKETGRSEASVSRARTIRKNFEFFRREVKAANNGESRPFFPDEGETEKLGKKRERLAKEKMSLDGKVSRLQKEEGEGSMKVIESAVGLSVFPLPNMVP